MLKITLEVEGMRCGMCETHVNDVVRRVEGVKKSRLLTQKPELR